MADSSIRVSATFRSAFSDVFNLTMVIVLTTGVLLSIRLIAIRGADFMLLLFIIFAIPFLLLYVWSILTRSWEVNSGGIIYREAFRKVAIRWDEVSSVHVEQWKKQITFTTNDDKETRIHTFGLNTKELLPVWKVFWDQVKSHDIIIE
jgi:hypothetical protein